MHLLLGVWQIFAVAYCKPNRVNKQLVRDKAFACKNIMTVNANRKSSANRNYYVLHNQLPAFKLVEAGKFDRPLTFLMIHRGRVEQQTVRVQLDCEMSSPLPGTTWALQ